MNNNPRIFLDVLPWDIRSRNTDWRYVRYALPCLKEFEPELNITLQTSNWISFRGNLKALAAAAGRRIKVPMSEWNLATGYLSERELARSGANVIFAQRSFPLNAGKVPIVWENAIVDQEMQRSFGITEAQLRDEVSTKAPLFRSAARVQVFSDAEAQRHSLMFPDIADRFVAVPWFAPHIQACSAEALEKHRQASPVRILFVGNNALRKGLDRLLEAFLNLPDAVRAKASLTVISNFDRSPMQIPSEEDITVIRGADSLTVMKEMQRSHIFVNVAHFETYGVVFHEAMSQGLACLAPNWEVQRELFDEGRAGMNLPCDPLPIRNALEKLIEDEEYRREIGIAAWNRFNNKYAPAVVARRYKDLFSKSLKQL